MSTIVKLIILVLLTGPVMAEPGFDPKSDMIADNYDAGSFLIYDCVERHWTCVTESYFKQCERRRKKDLANTESVYHSCAPIGSFPTKLSCFQRQLFMTSQDHGERICVKDEWKLKAVDF